MMDRVLMMLLGIALAMTGCADQRPASPSPGQGATALAFSPAECGRIDITSDAYGTRISHTSGPAGTEVMLSGTTVRGEDGRWAPSDRLEAWWNTESPGGPALRPGPVMKVVEVDDMERCDFETTFTIPSVEPGRYQISILMWEADPADGYGYGLPHHFTVTD